MKKALLIATLLALTGCMTVGTQFDSSKVDELKPGMAYEEVVTALGKPNSTEYAEDGRRAVTWNYVSNKIGSDRMGYVAILFDKDGKMIRIAKRKSH